MSPQLFLKFVGIDIGLIMIGFGYAWLNPDFYKQVIQIRNRILGSIVPVNQELPRVGRSVGYGCIVMGITLIIVIVLI